MAQTRVGRRKLLDAYYAAAIDVATLKAEQSGIAADARIAEGRLAALDAGLAEQRETLESAIRMAGTCAKAYQRATDRTRRKFNNAVIRRIEIRDGRVADVEYQPPFDVLFRASEFEYADLVGGEDALVFERHRTRPARCLARRPRACRNDPDPRSRRELGSPTPSPSTSVGSADSSGRVTPSHVDRTAAILLGNPQRSGPR